MNDFIKNTKRRIRRIQGRLLHSISQSKLDSVLGNTLRNNDGNSPDVLFVHSSLSRCGYLKPGATGLLQSLQQNCETLCLPTHTYCYAVDGQIQTYDPKTTPSKIGHTTNQFWKMPGVLRSLHPTHSLAALGPAAEEICRDHMACETACGSDTPYQRLIQLDAAVLMFGATMNTYTLFHCAEDEANCSYLYEPEPYEFQVKDYDGTVHRTRLYRQDMSTLRRFVSMRDELRQEGLLRVIPFGMNELLFIPSSKRVHEYTVGKLRENELHLVDHSARASLNGERKECQT